MSIGYSERNVEYRYSVSWKNLELYYTLLRDGVVLIVANTFTQFPELAASLLPICELFGSLTNAKTVATSLEGDPVTSHMLFTASFLQLMKLWKFHRPPLEHCLLGSGAGLGADLSLEYLLQLRNIQSNSTRLGQSVPFSLDSVPRLHTWYLQHQACISSTVSAVVRNSPLHQVADRLLAMMFTKGAGKTSSSSPGSHGGSEDAAGRPVLCAWEILAAVPIVLEYALSACSHGTLSSRELTTGTFSFHFSFISSSFLTRLHHVFLDTPLFSSLADHPLPQP